jgi:hypothetical protein
MGRGNGAKPVIPAASAPDIEACFARLLTAKGHSSLSIGKYAGECKENNAPDAPSICAIADLLIALVKLRPNGLYRSGDLQKGTPRTFA